MTNRVHINALIASKNLLIPAYCIPRDFEATDAAIMRSIGSKNTAAKSVSRKAGQRSDGGYFDYEMTFMSASGSVIGSCVVRVTHQ